MKLEDQVVSLELAKRLKELGMKQNTLFIWIVGHWQEQKEEIGMLRYVYEKGGDGFVVTASYPAPTVAELGEMLPIDCHSKRKKDGWYCFKEWNPKEQTSPIFQHYKTESDARARMVCYLIENGLVKV